MKEQFKVTYNDLSLKTTEHVFDTHQEALAFCKSDNECMGIMDFTDNTAYTHDEDDNWSSCPLDMLDYDDDEFDSFEEFVFSQEDTYFITVI